MNQIFSRTSRAILIAIVVLSSSAWAAEDKSGGGDLRSAVQNPISSLISLPFRLTLDSGATNGDATILNINPVIPVTVGDWNLVNRVLIPVANVDGAISNAGNPSPGTGDGGNASGLGDINYSIFFSPVKVDNLIWA